MKVFIQYDEIFIPLNDRTDEHVLHWELVEENITRKEFERKYSTDEWFIDRLGHIHKEKNHNGLIACQYQIYSNSHRNLFCGKGL